MAIRLHERFSQVAEVIHVIRPQHVFACTLQVALTPHIVRKIGQ